MTQILDQPDQQIFTRSASASTGAIAALVGGIALLLFAVAGFLLAVAADAGILSLQMTSTVPSLIGIALLIHAWNRRPTYNMVVVGRGGLAVLRSDGRSMKWTWSEVGWAHVKDLPMGNGRALVILAPDGRRLARLADSFSDFQQMVDLIMQYIDRRQDGTVQRLRRSQGKRTGALMMGIGIVFLAVTAGNLWMMFEDQRTERLLREQGVEGEAVVLRKFVARDGRTTRLEYRITSRPGLEAVRHVEVRREVWETTEEASRIGVTYVPDEPSISRLLTGQIDDGLGALASPAAIYPLSVLVGLLGLVGMVVGVLAWNGREIGLDPKTGKLALNPIGTGKAL